MMNLRTTLGVAIGVVLSATVLATAQDKKKGQPDPKEIEKAFKAYATPGKPHENFKRLVGRWNAAIVSFDQATGKPKKSKGTSIFRVILGGRYLQQNFRGKIEGENFRGIGTTGYDNAQKKYVGTWIDSMSTGIMHTEGKYDPKTNTMTEMGKVASPIGPMKMKMVTKYIDENKFHFTMSLVAEGGEQKMMEITYTRAASKKKGKKKTR